MGYIDTYMYNQSVNPNVCIVRHVPGADEFYIISYKPVGQVDFKMVMWWPGGDKTDAKDIHGVNAIEAVKAFLGYQ